MRAGVVCGRTACEAIGVDGVMVAVLGGGGGYENPTRSPHKRLQVCGDGGRTYSDHIRLFNHVVQFVSCIDKDVLFCCDHQRRLIRLQGLWLRALLQETRAEEGNVIRNKF